MKRSTARTLAASVIPLTLLLILATLHITQGPLPSLGRGAQSQRLRPSGREAQTGELPITSGPQRNDDRACRLFPGEWTWILLVRLHGVDIGDSIRKPVVYCKWQGGETLLDGTGTELSISGKALGESIGVELVASRSRESNLGVHGSVKIAQASPRAEIDLCIPSGSTAEVIVVDNAGTPIEEAVVTIDGAQANPGGSSAIWKLECSTGKDGRMTAPHLDESLIEAVWARKGGFGNAVAELPRCRLAFHGGLRLVLKPAVIVQGVVVDDQGRPIEGVSFQIHFETTIDGIRIQGVDRPTVRTNAHGEFNLPMCLSAGDSFYLEVASKSHIPLTTESIVVPRSHTVNSLTLQMQPGALLRGVVLDAGGHPVSGTVSVAPDRPRGREDSIEVPLAADGGFECSALNPSLAYEVEVRTMATIGETRVPRSYYLGLLKPDVNTRRFVVDLSK